MRALALDMLLELHQGETYSNILIGQVFEKYDYLSAQDKAFLKRLTEGVIERRITLDYVLDQFSKTPVKKMKPVIREILRMGVYQILYLDAVPDSAACNEAVKLTAQKHIVQLKGFVNGILRNIARQKEQITWPDERKDPLYALSIRTAMPMEILTLWEKDYGMSLASTMAEAMLKPGKVSIRRREDLSEDACRKLEEAWKKSGVQVTPSPYLPYAYLLSHVEGVQRLEGFAGGLITVQDVSSMLVTECAGIKENDLVLDVCAAPGGKSMHAAGKHPAAKVIARDVSPYRVELMEENAARCHLDNMTCSCADAAVSDETMIGKADVLYLDVPCSGLGIIGHKQDIKYDWSAEKEESLVKLQRQIVTSSIPYVKPGGTIIYSTCTVNRRENDQMRDFILEHFNVQAVSLDEHLPKNLQSRTTAQGYLQLMPGVQEADGFFIAKFRKG